jgi:hypothetical protein
MKRAAQREHVGWASALPDSERLAGLRDLYPEAFAEGKVDFDKLRGLLGGEIDERPERYSFTWAGKRDAIRLLQAPSASSRPATSSSRVRTWKPSSCCTKPISAGSR